MLSVAFTAHVIPISKKAKFINEFRTRYTTIFKGFGDFRKSSIFANFFLKPKKENMVKEIFF